MSIENPRKSQDTTVVNQVIVGAITNVFRSGASYKAVGEVVSRAAYPALATTFPPDGRFNSSSSALVGIGTIIPLSMASGAGVIIQVGSPASSTVYDKTYRLSDDGGRTWRIMDTLPTAGYWSSVIFANNQFVALSQTTASTSADGIHWSSASLPTSSTHGFSLAYGNGIYVAVGINENASQNIAMSSNDGQTWTARTMPSTNKWISVAFGNGLFVAITNDLTVAAASSTTGLTWIPQSLAQAAGVKLQKISFCDIGSGFFIAVGLSGLIVTTTNAVSWLTCASPRSDNNALLDLYSVAFGNGVIFISGANGIRVLSYDGLVFRKVIGVVNNATNVLRTIFGADGFYSFGWNDPNSSACEICYVENKTNSDLLYLSGDAGKFIRVK